MGRAIYAKRHFIENMFSRLKDCVRVAFRRDKTSRSWMGFVYLAAAMINLRIAKFSHTPQGCVSTSPRSTMRGGRSHMTKSANWQSNEVFGTGLAYEPTRVDELGRVNEDDLLLMRLHTLVSR